MTHSNRSPCLLRCSTQSTPPRLAHNSGPHTQPTHCCRHTQGICTHKHSLLSLLWLVHNAERRTHTDTQKLQAEAGTMTATARATKLQGPRHTHAHTAHSCTHTPMCGHGGRRAPAAHFSLVNAGAAVNLLLEQQHAHPSQCMHTSRRAIHTWQPVGGNTRTPGEVGCPCTEQ